MKDIVWQECRRKKKYLKKAAAERAAESQMKAFPGCPDLGIYQCPWCQSWHLYRIKN